MSDEICNNKINIVKQYLVKINQSDIYYFALAVHSVHVNWLNMITNQVIMHWNPI